MEIARNIEVDADPPALDCSLLQAVMSDQPNQYKTRQEQLAYDWEGLWKVKVSSRWTSYAQGQLFVHFAGSLDMERLLA